jgi:hypothetical protein
MARSGDKVAAGDGLGAFGAALILPVQTNSRLGRTAAGQWIQAKQSHPQAGLNIYKGNDQIRPQTINRPRSRARQSWAHPSPYRLTGALPPQPRESSPACHPSTGPGAEGGGGWPMHATAQPWHAEGRPSSSAAPRQRSRNPVASPCLADKKGWTRQERTAPPEMPERYADLAQLLITS